MKGIVEVHSRYRLAAANHNDGKWTFNQSELERPRDWCQARENHDSLDFATK